MRILLIQAGSRSVDSCPNKDTKTRHIVKLIKNNAPEGVTVDIVDLAIEGDGTIIQPCKGCVGTSSLHCHWGEDDCSCYGPGSASEDLYDAMYEKGIYKKLKACDGFMILGSVQWFNSPSQLVAMFQRLVSASLTITKEEAKVIFDGDIKNAEKTKAAEKSGKYEDLKRNQLTGKIAAFYVQGDGGAADYNDRELPESAKGKRSDMLGPDTSAYDWCIHTCRYMGIEVPPKLVKYVTRNFGNPYYKNDQTFKRDPDFIGEALAVFEGLIKAVKDKNEQEIKTSGQAGQKDD